MSLLCRLWLLMLTVGVVMMLFGWQAARAQDSEWVKQVLRLEYTTFCATVKPPPKALVESVQAAAQAGNTDAQVAFMWLVRILEQYQKAGCGDA